MKLTVDKSVWEKMKKNLRTGNNLEIRLGVFPESMYGPENDNLPVAQVFKWNEEGTEVAPPRPAFRVGFLAPVRKGMYNSYFRDSLKDILEGKTTFAKEYKILGSVMEKDLKEVIEDWSTPPNAPLTIELKGFNNPLIETEKMLNSIESKVAKRNS